MTTSLQVARGTLRLLSGVLTAKLLDFALYLVLARRLGVEAFGRYTFAFAFTLLFNIIADLGMTTVFTREAARTPGRVRALIGHALWIKLALGALTLAVTVVVSLVTHAPAETLALVAVLTLGMLANSTAALFEGLLKANGRAGQAGLSVLAQSVAALAVGVTLLAATPLGAMAGAGAYLVAALVHLGAAAAWGRDLWSGAHAPADSGPTPESNPTAPSPLRERLALLRESAPLAVSGVFIALYFRVDSVILHAVKGERAVGLYGGIYRFFEAFVLLSAAYRSVLFPVMARAADGPKEALGALCRKSLRIHLLFTIGVATFFTLEARPIVTLVLGAAYADAAPGLAVLMWALPGAFMADTLLHLLAAQRRQALGVRAAILTAVFNVALNLVLIPRFAWVGAAAATAASEAVCFALLFASFRDSAPRVGLFAAVLRPALAAGAVAVVLRLVTPALPGGVPGLAGAFALAVPAYALALVLTGGIHAGDAALARQLLPRALRSQRSGVVPP